MNKAEKILQKLKALSTQEIEAMSNKEFIEYLNDIKLDDIKKGDPDGSPDKGSNMEKLFI